jgi:hypothetical protein
VGYFNDVSNRRLTRNAKLAVILLVTLSLTQGRSTACASLSDSTLAFPTENFVTAERAVIIWDQAHKIEHFIRQASFLTQSPDIGFLVPTPQTPELAEVDNQIFDMAAFLSQPKKIPPTNYHSPWTLVSPMVTSSLLHLGWANPTAWLSGIGELKAKPTIVAERDIAGYHATILAADDEDAISAWLTKNGYLSTPELRAWMKPYIAAKWKITAFRLNKMDGAAPMLVTRAIRLSFPTDRPFYPYSEPSDRQQASAASPVGRALRVAILSDQRMTGSLADKTSWPAKLEFAGSSTPLPSKQNSWSAKQWLAFAKLDDAGHNTSLPTQLTTFIDQSNPRPGTADLYFSPDTDQSTFQGEAVDLTATPQDKLSITYSFADFAALLTLISLPAVPIYCGWKVLNLSPQKVTRHRPPSPLPQTKPWFSVADRFLGAVAIVIGVYYGIQFVLLIVGQIAATFLGWSQLDSNWMWTLVGLFLTAIPIAALSWAVIFCGVNVWRTRSTVVPIQQQNGLFYADGPWQGFMGTSSLVAGGIALLAVESVLYSLLTS